MTTATVEVLPFTVEKNGQRFQVNGNTEHIWKGYWNRVNQNKWENETFAILDAFLSPESLYVDIGAWIGPTVLYAAKRCARVVTFEPDPVALEALKTNIRLNPDLESKIELHECALSDRDGTIRLFSEKMGDSCSTIMSGGAAKHKKIIAANTAHYVEVPTRNIAEVYDEIGVGRADLVKIDIEGAEYHVLPAIAERLSSDKPSVYLSLHPFNLRPSGDSFQKNIRRLRETLKIFDLFSDYRHFYIFENGGFAPVRNDIFVKNTVMNGEFRGTILFTDKEVSLHS